MAAPAIRSGLRFWREERGLTQTALAQSAGIRQDRMSRFENGDALPTLAEADAISKALQVTLADLYSDDLLRAMRAAAGAA
jgi:transcriptional regulator with XRE-family HTH domain